MDQFLEERDFKIWESYLPSKRVENFMKKMHQLCDEQIDKPSDLKHQIS